MQIPYYLMSIDKISNSYVNVTVRIGAKFYKLVYFFKSRWQVDETKGEAPHWELDIYSDSTEKLRVDLENYAALGVTVESLDNIIPFITQIVADTQAQENEVNDAKRAIEEASQKETALAWYNRIKASDYSKLYNFGVAPSYSGPVVTFYHPKNEEVSVTIHWNNDKAKWTADYTYIANPNHGRFERMYRNGNKVNTKDMFGSKMRTFISLELDAQYNKYCTNNSAKTVQVWFDTHKDALKTNGFTVPYSHENKKSMWRKINGSTTEEIFVDVSNAIPDQVVITQIVTRSTIVETPDLVRSDMVMKNILSVDR